MQTKLITPRSLLVIGMLSIVALVAAACSSEQNPVVTQEESAPVKTATEQVVEIIPTEVPEDVAPTTEIENPPITPTDDPVEEGEEQSESYPAPEPAPTIDLDPYPSPEEAAAPPPVKTELEATDPSTVVLASGKPQLIEFFAFW